MKFKEVWNLLPSHGWLDREEAELLWELARRANGSILEVGCYHGHSTVLLALACPLVHAVDPFSDFDSDDPSGHFTHGTFLSNLAERGIENVILYRERIEDWHPMPVSMAYLDGDHTYRGTMDQIEKALACTPKMIAIHDVNDGGEGREIRRAALEALETWDERVGRLAVWNLG